jgi:hypothetical protein
LAGQAPPQSRPLSPGLFTPSAHDSVLHCSFRQMPLSQSPLDRHCLENVQGGHVPPPQSRSVSARFLSLSSQPVAMQRPWLQALLAQSEDELQRWFTPHFAQLGPPQSTSLSSSLRA